MSMPLDFGQQKNLQAGIDIARPPIPLLGAPVLKLEEAYGLKEVSSLQPPFSALLPVTKPHLERSQYTYAFGLNLKATPSEALWPSQRRLLIIDQSGNQTRLIRCCAFPPESPLNDVPRTVPAPDAHDVEKLRKMGRFALETPTEHVFGGDHVNGGDSEMHEDTEEINALLYSDEDDDYDDDSDDEVMSTDHSPFPIKEIHEETQKVEETAARVATINKPRKRQKLVDGGYGRLSVLDTASSANPERSSADGNVADSAEQTEIQKTGLTLSDSLLRRDKIRTALRILESIIPGTNEKDSISVLDEAIDYLKLLKQNVKALGVNDF